MRAKNCRIMSTFVKVICRKNRGLFFSGHGACMSKFQRQVRDHDELDNCVGNWLGQIST